MSSIQFALLPAPDLLKKEVECVRIAHYTGEEGFALTASPNGMPGIVFHKHDGFLQLFKGLPRYTPTREFQIRKELLIVFALLEEQEHGIVQRRGEKICYSVRHFCYLTVTVQRP